LRRVDVVCRNREHNYACFQAVSSEHPNVSLAFRLCSGLAEREAKSRSSRPISRARGVGMGESAGFLMLLKSKPRD
jgi:3-oxoacyl-(acyl-carrier-protein) synthase